MSDSANQSDPSTIRITGSPQPRAAASANSRRLTAAECELIKDDTSIRRAETPALFRLLATLESDPVADDDDYFSDVGFAQIYRQPDVYRGKPVATRGTIRRIVRRRAPPNDAGLSEYFQVWFQPHDNPAAPLAVFCRRLPENLVPADDVAESATVRGVFFKRWAYQAQDVARAAPLLIAATVHVEPQRPPVQTAKPLLAPWQVVPLAALLAAAVVIFVRQRGRSLRPVTGAALASPSGRPQTADEASESIQPPPGSPSASP